MSLQLWNSIFSYDVDKRISVGVSDAINKKDDYILLPS